MDEFGAGGSAVAGGSAGGSTSDRDNSPRQQKPSKKMTGKRRRADLDADTTAQSPRQPGRAIDSASSAGSAGATPAAKHARGLYGRVSGFMGRAVGLLTPGRARAPVNPDPAAAGTAVRVTDEPHGDGSLGGGDLGSGLDEDEFTLAASTEGRSGGDRDQDRADGNGGRNDDDDDYDGGHEERFPEGGVREASAFSVGTRMAEGSRGPSRRVSLVGAGLDGGISVGVGPPDAPGTMVESAQGQDVSHFDRGRSMLFSPGVRGKVRSKPRARARGTVASATPSSPSRRTSGDGLGFASLRGSTTGEGDGADSSPFPGLLTGGEGAGDDICTLSRVGDSRLSRSVGRASVGGGGGASSHRGVSFAHGVAGGRAVVEERLLLSAMSRRPPTPAESARDNFLPADIDDDDDDDAYSEMFTLTELRDFVRSLRYRRGLPPAAAIFLLSKMESPRAALLRRQILEEYQQAIAAAAGSASAQENMVTAEDGTADSFGRIVLGTNSAPRDPRMTGSANRPLLAPVARRRVARLGADLVPSAPLRSPLMQPPPPRGNSYRVSPAADGDEEMFEDGNRLAGVGKGRGGMLPPPARGGDEEDLLTPARRRSLAGDDRGGRERMFAHATPGGARIWKPAATVNQGTPWAARSNHQQQRQQQRNSIGASREGHSSRSMVVVDQSPLRRDRFGATPGRSGRMAEWNRNAPSTPAAMARKIISVLNDAGSPRSPPRLTGPERSPSPDSPTTRPKRHLEDGPLPTRTLSVPHPTGGGGTRGEGQRRDDVTGGTGTTPLTPARLPPSRWARRSDLFTESRRQTVGSIRRGDGRRGVGISDDDMDPTPVSRKRKTSDHGTSTGKGTATRDSSVVEGGDDADGRGKKNTQHAKMFSSPAGSGGGGGAGLRDDHDDTTSPPRTKRARTSSEGLLQQQSEDKENTTSSGAPTTLKTAAGKAAEDTPRRDRGKGIRTEEAGSSEGKQNEGTLDGAKDDRTPGGVGTAGLSGDSNREPGHDLTEEARRHEARRRGRQTRSPYVYGGGRVDPNAGLPKSIRPSAVGGGAIGGDGDAEGGGNSGSSGVGESPFAGPPRTPSKYWTCRGCYVRNYSMEAKACDMCRMARNFGTPQHRNPPAVLPGGRMLYSVRAGMEAAGLATPVRANTAASGTSAAGGGSAPAPAAADSTTSGDSVPVKTGPPSKPSVTFNFSGSATGAGNAAPAPAAPAPGASPVVAPKASPAFSFTAGGGSSTTPAAAAPTGPGPRFSFGAGAAKSKAPAASAPAAGDAANSSSAMTAPTSTAPGAASAAPATPAFTFGAKPVAAASTAPSAESVAPGAGAASSSSASGASGTPAITFGAVASAPAPSATPSTDVSTSAPAPAATISGTPSFTFGGAATTAAAATIATPAPSAAPTAAAGPTASFTFGATAPAPAPAASSAAKSSGTTPASFTFGAKTAATGTSAAGAAAAPTVAAPSTTTLFGGTSSATPATAAPAFSFGATAPAPGATIGPAAVSSGKATAQGGVGIAAPTPSGFSGFGAGGGFGAGAGADSNKRASSPALGGFGLGSQGPSKRGPAPAPTGFGVGGGFGGAGIQAPMPPAPAAPGAGFSFGQTPQQQPAAASVAGGLFGAAAAAPQPQAQAHGAAFSFGGAPAAAAPPPAGVFGAAARPGQFGAPASAAPPMPGGFGAPGVAVGGGFGVGVPSAAAPATGGFNLGAGAQPNPRAGRRIVKAARRPKVRK